MRQLVDSNAGVVLAQAYEPYGQKLKTAGRASSAYGYTGEWQDSSRIYLRARFYTPGTGRFISRDTWDGDANRPASYNKWLYGYANPINYTDPFGKSPQCDDYQRADLTQWLIDEMNANRDGPIAQLISSNLWKWEDPIAGGNPISFGAAYITFMDAVKTHGLWDFKWEIKKTIGKNILLAENWYKNDVPGNIHFGYIGKAVGFAEEVIHCGADYAHNGRICSSSDPQLDFEEIEVGFDIWRLSGGGLVDEGILKTALALHPLIANGIETIPNRNSLSIPWPYPVGTFDDGSSGWFIKSR